MANAESEFTPVNVCSGCNQITPQCHCEGAECQNCRGKGFVVACIDDLCHAQNRCMHGDNPTCSDCDGRGVLPPKRVLVSPDQDAYRIREYLRDHPQLRKDDYRTEQTETNPLLGLCYPAAEAYYHRRDCDLDVYCLSWSDVDGVDDDETATHWYLREPDGRQRWIDLGLPLMPPVGLPPFEEGTRRGFITGDQASKRTQQVLDGIEAMESTVNQQE